MASMTSHSQADSPKNDDESHEAAAGPNHEPTVCAGSSSTSSMAGPLTNTVPTSSMSSRMKNVETCLAAVPK
jgi:hypothetical protein